MSHAKESVYNKDLYDNETDINFVWEYSALVEDLEIKWRFITSKNPGIDKIFVRYFFVFYLSIET